ncbi:flavin reductase family protein [Tessaracoccus caeni]|uniref:flavin reductase family protein n=1 Tax=Tessaracoccus caeni TaxID=3031239 RepID=UPI0023DA7286|nr:flavin reductase family protein [Tessaracoccus caeni]MDF1489666.1 flavin reductase family protein [Tessaracoccus caeni]
MSENQGHRVIEPSVLYVGTPVYLVATRNPDGSPNLAPASSHFALGRMIVLGLEEGGQSLDNVRAHPELTVNFPASHQWTHVERLAGVTGKNPVPEDKAAQYEFEPHKFERAGLTSIPSQLVDVPRVAEAPLQLEAQVRRITPGVAGIYAMVEAEVVRVHAASAITVEGTEHLDPEAWHPLLYAYRHFYDRGPEVGWTRKSPLATPPAPVAAWEQGGGSWRVRLATETAAEVDLLAPDGTLAEIRSLTSERDVRWALVQHAIQGDSRVARA